MWIRGEAREGLGVQPRARDVQEGRRHDQRDAPLLQLPAQTPDVRGDEGVSRGQHHGLDVHVAHLLHDRLDPLDVRAARDRQEVRPAGVVPGQEGHDGAVARAGLGVEGIEHVLHGLGSADQQQTAAERTRLPTSGDPASHQETADEEEDDADRQGEGDVAAGDLEPDGEGDDGDQAEQVQGAPQDPLVLLRAAAQDADVPGPVHAQGDDPEGAEDQAENAVVQRVQAGHLREARAAEAQLRGEERGEEHGEDVRGQDEPRQTLLPGGPEDARADGGARGVRAPVRVHTLRHVPLLRSAPAEAMHNITQ